MTRTFFFSQRSLPGALLLILLSVSCGGPNFYFDPAPIPEWTRHATSQIGPATIEMVGTAPVTTQVKNDFDLAVREAKNRIAQLFMSQVVSHSSDWSLSLTNNGQGSEDRQVLQQNIEVRTNVKVNNVKVVAQYRDEETSTQYVRVTVDRHRWATRLNRRTEETFRQLQGESQRARSAMQANHPLQAYQALLRAYQSGQELEPDIIVLELLAPRQGAQAKLREIHQTLRQIGEQLRENFQFAISIQCADPNVARDVKTNLETFLNDYGFSTGREARLIRVEAQLGERFLKKERIAGRTEFVHAATGKLRVLEPDGSEVRSLAFHLPPETYTEQAPRDRVAITRALRLAADTVTSKFRSQFRNAFPRHDLQ
jgi:hypothetical protein